MITLPIFLGYIVLSYIISYLIGTIIVGFFSLFKQIR